MLSVIFQHLRHYIGGRLSTTDVGLESLIKRFVFHDNTYPLGIICRFLASLCLLFVRRNGMIYFIFSPYQV